MLKQAIRKRLGKAAEEEKGFTLIELLAVIVIIGIIAVIAIPMIGNILDKSKKDADLATARQIYDAARIYIISENNGTVPTVITLGTLQAGKYLESQLYLPSDKTLLDPGTTKVDYEADGKLKDVVLNGKSPYSLAQIMSVDETATPPATTDGN